MSTMREDKDSLVCSSQGFLRCGFWGEGLGFGFAALEAIAQLAFGKDITPTTITENGLGFLFEVNRAYMTLKWQDFQ